jgi:hypothetical protein
MRGLKNERPNIQPKTDMHGFGNTRITQTIRKEGDYKMTETQGKTEKSNINQDKQQTQPTESVSLKAGTATSSPTL